MNMIRVIVYLDHTSANYESIYMSGDSTREDVLKRVNYEYGSIGWISYDILDFIA